LGTLKIAKTCYCWQDVLYFCPIQVLSLPFCFTLPNLKKSLLFQFFRLSKTNRQNIVCQSTGQTPCQNFTQRPIVCTIN
jgi:prepilin signal peptidase PulO-like enzyme (type II secretory pathway)